MKPREKKMLTAGQEIAKIVKEEKTAGRTAAATIVSAKATTASATVTIVSATVTIVSATVTIASVTVTIMMLKTIDVPSPARVHVLDLHQRIDDFTRVY